MTDLMTDLMADLMADLMTAAEPGGAHAAGQAGC